MALSLSHNETSPPINSEWYACQLLSIGPFNLNLIHQNLMVSLLTLNNDYNFHPLVAHYA